MKRINGISADSRQRLAIPLDDGTVVDIVLGFIPRRNGWFILELTYGDFILRGFKVFNSDNILHQYRNQLPFGIACYSKEFMEPQMLESFDLENSKLYILSKEETEFYWRFLSGTT